MRILLLGERGGRRMLLLLGIRNSGFGRFLGFMVSFVMVRHLSLSLVLGHE
jgi:hypothetical protein